MSDVFGLLSDLDLAFQYDADAWNRVAEVVSSLGFDPGEVKILYDEWPLDAAEVPLRNALEIELQMYAAKVEFTRRYPSMTKYQIATKQKKMKRVVSELARLVKEPELALYLLDWGSHRGGPKGTILLLDKLLQTLREREEWLATTNPNSPFPGHASPRDCGPPAEGFQWQHYELSSGEPKCALITGVLRIYAKIFRRSPGTQDDGPGARFLQAAVWPMLGKLSAAELRYWLRKFRD
jgi:hypothetical protein